MFASPGFAVRVAWIAGWPRRLVPPVSFRASFGPNARLAQLPAWKCEETDAVAPSLPAIVPVVANGSQLVGLSANSGRFRSIRMLRTRSGMPPRICGSGSLTAVTWAVAGFTCSAARTATLPRS